jgi:hypothetical protein
MNKKPIVFVLMTALSWAIIACGGGGPKAKSTEPNSDASTSTNSAPSDYDPKRGEGKFNESNVTLGALDYTMAGKGEAIAATKCTSCHKLTEERLVGPGWKGVTTRNTPYWILNFISNPDPMIEKDPKVQAQLELCLVRMPNQGLTDTDAREILEFMRKNDETK